MKKVNEIRKVQLILPSHDYQKLTHSKVIQPYGLLRLGTYLKEKMQDVDVEILNEELTPYEKIVKKLNANLVGISTNTLNYSHALNFAKEAKKRDATVVLGGLHATYLSREVLKNRPYVDYVVIGQGEKALLELVKGTDPSEINNLAYKNGNEIRINPREFLNLNEFPVADRSLINMEEYFENSYYFRRFPGVPARRASIFTQNRCNWKKKTWDAKTKTGGCIFCALENYESSAINPKKAWEEIEYLVKEFDVGFIEDESNSFLSDKNWLREFYRRRPNEINSLLRVYVRVAEIDEEVVKILSILNVNDVIIGFEEGTNRGLKAIKKGTTLRQNIKAAELLTKYDIGIIGFFVEMYPGEDKESAEENYNFAKYLYKNFKVHGVGANVLLPAPGTECFRMLIEKEPKYAGRDLLDAEEIKIDFARHFCPEPYSFYLDNVHNILRINEINNNNDLIEVFGGKH